MAEACSLSCATTWPRPSHVTFCLRNRHSGLPWHPSPAGLVHSWLRQTTAKATPEWPLSPPLFVTPPFKKQQHRSLDKTPVTHALGILNHRYPGSPRSGTASPGLSHQCFRTLLSPFHRVQSLLGASCSHMNLGTTPRSTGLVTVLKVTAFMASRENPGAP